MRVRILVTCARCGASYGRGDWQGLHLLVVAADTLEMWEQRQCPCGAGITRRVALTEAGEAAVLEANLSASVEDVKAKRATT